MILRVDPRLPLVWRSPTSAQIGIDPPALVLPNVTETDERILAALVAGISRTGLTMLTKPHPKQCDDLLAAVSSVLVTTPPVASSANIAVLGSGLLVQSIAQILDASGAAVTVAATSELLPASPFDLVILVNHFVIAPSVYMHWLRRDIPHLPVVLSDSAAEIGPVVTPGTTGCLLCVDLYRRDTDPAWPAIATQLVGRTSLAETPVLVAEAAAESSRLALHHLGRTGHAVTDHAPTNATYSVRIDLATGRRDERAHYRHADCGCQQMGDVSREGGALAGLQETGSAPDGHLDPVVHSPTTTSRATDEHE